MSNINRLLFFCGLVAIAAVPNVHGHLNLYLNQHEVMRLLGEYFMTYIETRTRETTNYFVSIIEQNDVFLWVEQQQKNQRRKNKIQMKYCADLALQECFILVTLTDYYCYRSFPPHQKISSDIPISCPSLNTSRHDTHKTIIRPANN